MLTACCSMMLEWPPSDGDDDAAAVDVGGIDIGRAMGSEVGPDVCCCCCCVCCCCCCCSCCCWATGDCCWAPSSGGLNWPPGCKYA